MRLLQLLRTRRNQNAADVIHHILDGLKDSDDHSEQIKNSNHWAKKTFLGLLQFLWVVEKGYVTNMEPEFPADAKEAGRRLGGATA